MSSILITGVSRGLGYELLRQYSHDPPNTVIGIVRNKAVTEKKLSEDPAVKGRSNIYLLQADLTDYDALKQAAADTAKITGGSLYYLIACAGYVSRFDMYDGLGDLGAQPEELTKVMRQLFDTNVIAQIHLINLFLPLVRQGAIKKVVAFTSGYGDAQWTNDTGIEGSPLYAISKVALNMVVAKFNAQFKKDGVLFVALCPGPVDTDHFEEATPEQKKRLEGTLSKFLAYEPDFKGHRTTEVAVASLIPLIESFSIRKGHGGGFLLQFGNQRWI